MFLLINGLVFENDYDSGLRVVFIFLEKREHVEMIMS
jgi:hypothetical protein